MNGSSNAPLRGVKGETREGGIRVPFLLRWPGRLPAGATYDRPVIQLDLHPTALEAAGAPVPADAKPDGVDLLPYLTGSKSGDPHELLYWRFNFPPRQPARYKWAIRRGDWKLFTDVEANRKNKGRAAASGGRMLVDLAGDIGERTDQSGRHPEELKALEAAWNRWDAEMAAPGATPERPEKGRGGDR